MIYDDYRRAELDPQAWTLVQVMDARGEPTVYRDDNAVIDTGAGQLRVTVDPFTRFHDSDAVRNNAKQLHISTERFATRPGTEVRFEADMAVTTHRQIPFDTQDAYGTVNLIDFASLTVLAFAATNDTVYAIHERLRDFRHRVLLDVPADPGREHHYAISYRHDTSTATWYADGQAVYWARTATPVEGFHLGMGLFSSRDLTRYSRAEREHGQGATGCWRPWQITEQQITERRITETRDVVPGSQGRLS